MKKFLRRLIPSRLLDLFKNLENLDNKMQNLENLSILIDRLDTINGIQKDIQYLKEFQKYTTDITQLPKANGLQRTLQLGNHILLKIFDKKCKEYNIEYMLLGGILLGAIRHKGFIPWDDDIDIWMHYKDLQKIILLFEDDLIFTIRPTIQHRGLHIHIFYIKDMGFNNFRVEIFSYIDVQINSVENIESYTQKRAICREDIDSRVCKITNNAILYYPDNELINQVSQVYSDNLIAYIGNPNSTDGNYITRTITEFNMPPYSPPILFFDKEDIFPLTTVIFEGHEYKAPKNTLKFLTMYYNGNPFAFPNSFDTHDDMIDEKNVLEQYNQLVLLNLGGK